MNCMNNLVNDFWKRLTYSRPDTLSVMSEKTGIPLATIKGWYSKGRLPKLEDAIIVSEYLGCSLDWLVLGKDVEKGSNKVSSLVQAYILADELTKSMVDRLLQLS